MIGEHDYFSALATRRLLMQTGFAVRGIAGHTSSALKLIEEIPIDAAILEAWLGCESAEPVARMLRRLNIPFVVVANFGNYRPNHWVRGAPLVLKPYAQDELIGELRRITRARGRSKCDWNVGADRRLSESFALL